MPRANRRDVLPDGEVQVLHCVGLGNLGAIQIRNVAKSSLGNPLASVLLNN